jgi:hypothetical protein
MQRYRFFENICLKSNEFVEQRSFNKKSYNHP